MSALSVVDGCKAPFGPIEVGFDRTVLRPRPWTVAQSRWAAELAHATPAGPIAELFCGAGQIGLVAALGAGRSLVQVDDDERACRWARRNARRAGVDSDVRCGVPEDALRPDERFPLMVVDPPYVPSGEAAGSAEPRHAIDGGRDGLEVLERCLPVLRRHLLPCAPALLQVRGLQQAARLEPLIAGTGGLVLEMVQTHGPHGAVVLVRADP